jgi:hypothetical protein
MLQRYAFSNFYSFRDPVEVSLRLNRHVPWDDLSFDDGTDQRLSKLLAIVGPNGSGKTTLLKPVAFLAWFVNASFQADPQGPIPIEPHFSQPDAPTKFEIEVDEDGALWRYVLEVTKERVLKEALYKKTSRLFSYVFTREWLADERRYLIKQRDFGFLQKEAEKVRENASLIATAAQYDVPLAKLFSQPNIAYNVLRFGREPMGLDRMFKAAAFFSADEALRERMSDLLRQWDLGLQRVEIRQMKTTDRDGKESEWHLPFGLHHLDGQELSLSFFEESSGTQSAFVLLSQLLPVLRDGGLAVIDELENDLHPHMIRPILDLFIDPELNPHHAQMIFTCHSTEVLNQLHKAQVMLVEKDERCGSEAWRLDSVKGLRADDNLYAKYMAGAYGAVPRL